MEGRFCSMTFHLSHRARSDPHAMTPYHRYHRKTPNIWVVTLELFSARGCGEGGYIFYTLPPAPISLSCAFQQSSARRVNLLGEVCSYKKKLKVRFRFRQHLEREGLRGEREAKCGKTFVNTGDSNISGWMLRSSRTASGVPSSGMEDVHL